MERKENAPESLHTLVLRSVAVTVAVLGLLLGLRLGGVTAVEQDVPIQMVEGIVQMAVPGA